MEVNKRSRPLAVFTPIVRCAQVFLSHQSAIQSRSFIGYCRTNRSQLRYNRHISSWSDSDTNSVGNFLILDTFPVKCLILLNRLITQDDHFFPISPAANCLHGQIFSLMIGRLLRILYIYQLSVISDPLSAWWVVFQYLNDVSILSLHIVGVMAAEVVLLQDESFCLCTLKVNFASAFVRMSLK